jgi:hypothetical protein
MRGNQKKLDLKAIVAIGIGGMVGGGWPVIGMYVIDS